MIVFHKINKKSAEFYVLVVGNRTANSIPMTAWSMAVAVAVAVDTWDIADVCYTDDDMVDTVVHTNMVDRMHMLALPIALVLSQYRRCRCFACSYRQSLHVMFQGIH